MHLLASVDALRRGYVEGDEVCEIAGVGPVPVRVARDYLTDAFLTIVLRDGQAITSITPVGRNTPAKLRPALVVDGLESIVPGCNTRGYLEHDHRHDYALGG